jgi:hypothetical protein
MLVFATWKHTTVRPLQPRRERKQGSRQHRGVHHPVAIRPIGLGDSGMARTIVFFREDYVQSHFAETYRTDMAAA